MLSPKGDSGGDDPEAAGLRGIRGAPGRAGVSDDLLGGGWGKETQRYCFMCVLNDVCRPLGKTLPVGGKSCVVQAWVNCQLRCTFDCVSQFIVICVKAKVEKTSWWKYLTLKQCKLYGQLDL